MVRIWVQCGLFSLLCGIAPIAASQPAKSHPKVFPAPNVPGLYVDVTAKAGVHFQHVAPHTSRKYSIETMGSGVALFDCDNDGRLDIFLVNGAPYSERPAKDSSPRKPVPKTGIASIIRKPMERLKTSRRKQACRVSGTAWELLSPTMTTMAMKISS